MKIYLLFAMVLSLGLTFTSCNDDHLDSESIFQDEDTSKDNNFDKWIYTNYTVPYNIRLMYQMEDIESDYQYTLAPAQYEQSIRLAHIIKYVWIDAYAEVAGSTFIRKYVPKVLHFIGSSGYNSSGTEILGTAEGGIKVTLYKVNDFTLDANVLNEYYFKTMHHEFSHILHQTKDFDTQYKLITEGDYVSGDWYLYSQNQALQKGFITPYSMSEPREDIAEMTAEYIVLTPTQWNAHLAAAGTYGADKIKQKLDIVKTYMTDSWGIDLDQLRDVTQRRMNDVVNGRIDLESLK